MVRIKQDSESAILKTPVLPDVLDDDMAAILRAKSPAERLAIAFGLWRFAQQLIRRIARAEHPDWSDAELERHVARRMSHGAF